MSTDAVVGFVQVIGQHHLLENTQHEELVRTLQHQFAQPRDLLRDLVQRGWLTPYQANQLAMGKGSTLVLGSYVLLERLGETVMGEMYRARHQKMRRMVALQVIRADLLQHDDAVQRFYQEIQAASVLLSPHVVAAYDAGPSNDNHFFAMEFVEGVDLARLVQEAGSLPVEQACDYTCQAALGLQHAYERGLLHHDLTPTNLLIVARSPGPRKLGPPSGAGRRRTALGAGALLKIQNLGLTFACQQRPRTGAAAPFTTADFLAPEVGRGGRAPDVRSEIYSLGCCLYYQLAGRVPFPGGTSEDKQRRHQNEDPAPLEMLRAEVPAEVNAVLRSLMAKRPEERFGTPGEVAAALVPLLQTSSVSLAPPLLPAEEQATFVDRPRPATLPDIRNDPASAAALELNEPVDEPHAPRPAVDRRTVLGIVAASIMLPLAAISIFMHLMLARPSPSGEGPGHGDTASVVPPVRDRLGKRFNGLEDYFDVAHSPVLEPPQLTVETWLQVSELPLSTEDKRRWIINKNTHEHAQGHYGLLLNGAKVGTYLNIGGGPENCFDLWSPTEVVQLDRWHHLAMTYDGSALRLYFDGAEVARRDVNRARVAGTTPLTIGRRQDGAAGLAFKGRLDDIRLYNRALAADEVQAHFTNPAASVAKPERGLVKFWRY